MTGEAKQTLLAMRDLGLLDVVKEIAQTNRAFREALGNWADKRGDLGFVFDLMDLGMPSGKLIGFLNPKQKDRVRELTVQMGADAAKALVDVLAQPGKVVDMARLIAEFGLKGRDIQRLTEAIREALLDDPALAASPTRLEIALRRQLPPVAKKASAMQVRIDADETLKARKKWPMYNEIIVGTFESPVTLYRTFDGKELQHIRQSGKITGGAYSVSPERAYGASWGYDLTHAVNMANNHRNKRLGPEVYVAKMEGLDKKFLHLGPPGLNLPDDQVVDGKVISLPKSTCFLGLGCSVSDVSVQDVDDFYEVVENDQVRRIDLRDIKVAVEEWTDERVVAQVTRPKQATDYRAELPKDLSGFEYVWGLMKEEIEKERSSGMEHNSVGFVTNGTIRHWSNIFNTLFKTGSVLARAVVETKEIPAGQERKLERVSRLFLTARQIPRDIPKWFDKNRDDIDFLLNAAKTWGERVEGTNQKFKVGPFTIHNTIGLSGPDLENTKEVIEKCLHLIQGVKAPSDARKVLYGDIFIVARLQKSNALAWYYHADDAVYVRPFKKGTATVSTVHRLIHELGHRYLHRFAPSDKQLEWQRVFNFLQSTGSMTRVKMPGVGDPLPVPIKGYKGFPPVVKLDYSRIYVEVTDKKLGTPKQISFPLTALYNILEGEERQKQYPTPYSAASKEEFFSEAFSLRVQDQLLPAWKQDFDRIWGSGGGQEEALMEIKVAHRYLTARNTQQFVRVEKMLKDFRELLPGVWGGGIDDAKAEQITKAAREVYDSLVFQFDSEYAAKVYDKVVKRKIENFRKFLLGLSQLHTGQEQMAYLQKWGGRTKGFHGKFWDAMDLTLGTIRSLDEEIEGSLEVADWRAILLTSPKADWDENKIDRLKWVLAEADKMTSARGFRGIAYGRVNAYPSSNVPVSGHGSSSTLASYNMGNDLIRLAVGASDINRTLIDLVHELGHRFYFRSMGSQGRKAWGEFFEASKGVPDVDRLIADWEKWAASATSWDDKKYGRFMSQYYPYLKKTNPEQAVWLIIVVDHLKINEPQTYAGPKKGTIPALDQLIARKGEVKVFLHPVTSYSATEPEELFAETFSFIVFHGPGSVPEIVRETFRKAVPQVKVGREAETFEFNVGEPVLYGKYKNKHGILKGFSKDKHGNPIILVEPVPKGRKQDKVIQLFRVWKDQSVQKVARRFLASLRELVLFHGTSLTAYGQMKQEGHVALRGERPAIHLTGQRDYAEEFARQAAKRDGSVPVVLTVRVPIDSHLYSGVPAMELIEDFRAEGHSDAEIEALLKKRQYTKRDAVPARDISKMEKLGGSVRRVAARFIGRLAKEFPSEDALKQYLTEHPKADRKNHWVKEQEEAPKKAPKKEAPAKDKAPAEGQPPTTEPTTKETQKQIKQKNDEDFIRGWQGGREKDIKSIRTIEVKTKPVKGKITPDHVKTIAQNAIANLRSFSANLAADDVEDINEFITSQSKLVEKLVKSGEFSEVDAEKINTMFMDAVDNMAYQTNESYRRSLGDHGARHIMGNIRFQNKVMDSLAGGGGAKVTDKDRLLAAMVMANHDLGYTAAPASVGTADNPFFYTGKHKEYGIQIFESEYEDDYRDIFGDDDLARMKHYIATHDSDEVDWENDPVGSAVRTADNLALYAPEKLPGLFRFVDGSVEILQDMAGAIRKKPPDEDKFKELKVSLEKKVDDSKLSPKIKEALKHATGEITPKTPKFTLGMLAGEVKDINFDGKALHIKVKKDEFDTKLQKMFDMGQRQFQKFAEAYGHKDFTGNYFEFKKDGKTLMKVSLEDEDK